MIIRTGIVTNKELQVTLSSAGRHWALDESLLMVLNICPNFQTLGILGDGKTPLCSYNVVLFTSITRNDAYVINVCICTDYVRLTQVNTSAFKTG